MTENINKLDLLKVKRNSSGWRGASVPKTLAVLWKAMDLVSASIDCGSL